VLAFGFAKRERGVASVRRLLMLASVVLVIAAMMVATAVPGFAAEKCELTETEEGDFVYQCRGGEGARGGNIGDSGQETVRSDESSVDYSQTGGGGDGAGGPGVQGGGGGGANVSGTFEGVTYDAQGQGGGGSGGKNREPDGGSGGQCSIEDNEIVEERGDCPIGRL
jgi:hypothetical protein